MLPTLDLQKRLKFLDVVIDLVGEFAGRGEDENAGTFARAVRRFEEPIEDGQHEGGRFPSARLGGGHEVAAFEDDGNGFALDWSGGGEVGGLDGIKKPLVEFEVVELHDNRGRITGGRWTNSDTGFMTKASGLMSLPTWMSPTTG